MSNHTIKAKNKKTGEIIDVRYEKGFTRFDGYGYAILKNTVCVDVLSQQEFNDRFELVEDKNCSSFITQEIAKAKEDIEKIINNYKEESKHGDSYKEDEYYMGKVQACDDIINLINNK